MANMAKMAIKQNPTNSQHIRLAGQINNTAEKGLVIQHS